MHVFTKNTVKNDIHLLDTTKEIKKIVLNADTVLDKHYRGLQKISHHLHHGNLNATSHQYLANNPIANIHEALSEIKKAKKSLIELEKDTKEHQNALQKVKKSTIKKTPRVFGSHAFILHASPYDKLSDSRKNQYENICELMRNLITSAAYIQTFYAELEKKSAPLNKIYAALSNMDPEKIKKMSRKDIIAGIKSHFEPLQSQILETVTQLNPYYVMLRKDVDKTYRETLEKGEKINHSLKKMSEEFGAISKICLENKVRLTSTVNELNTTLQEILLNNTLNQNDFKKILQEALKILNKLRLEIYQEFKEPEKQELLNAHLKQIQDILSGELSEDLLAFRKSLLGSVAASAIEFALPLVTGALNALVPIPLPIAYLAPNINTGIMTAGSLLVSETTKAATKEKYSSIDKLDQEWQKLWYIEALKSADIVKKGVTYVAALGTSALLTALGAPHLATLLVPVGISASGIILPKAIEKVDVYAKEKAIFDASIKKLKSLEKDISTDKEIKSTKTDIHHLIKDLLQFDEKQMIQFEIEATKIQSIKDYYQIEAKISNLETIMLIEHLKSTFNNDNIYEIWSLLKIYADASQLSAVDDPAVKASLLDNLKTSIDHASMHFLKNYKEYQLPLEFEKVLLECKKALPSLEIKSVPGKT